MQLTHRLHLPIPLPAAFETFSHLEQVARCFPGAAVTEVDEDQFDGSLAVKLGAVPLLFSGTGRYRERSPGRHRVVLAAHGRDRRGSGSADLVVTVHLNSRGDGTDVAVVTDLELTGRAAAFGTAVVSEVADRLYDQFSRCLGGQLTAGSSRLPVLTGQEPAPAPSRIPAPSTLLVRYAAPAVAVAALTWLGAWWLRRVSR